MTGSTTDLMTRIKVGLINLIIDHITLGGTEHNIFGSVCLSSVQMTPTHLANHVDSASYPRVF